MDTKEEVIRKALEIKNRYPLGDPHSDGHSPVHGEQLSAFTILAHCAGLAHLYGNIYTDEHGSHFVQTRYGFQPFESFNKGIIIRELYKRIHVLEEMLKDHDESINSLNNENKNLFEKESEAVNRIKELTELVAKKEAEEDKKNDEKKIKELKTLLQKEQKLKAEMQELLSMNEKFRIVLMNDKKRMHDRIQHLEKDREKHENEIESLKTQLKKKNVETEKTPPQWRTEGDKQFISFLKGMKAVLRSSSITLQGKMTRLQNYIAQLEKLGQ